MLSYQIEKNIELNWILNKYDYFCESKQMFNIDER